MQYWFGIGRLTQDPQMQTFDSGKRKCRFSLAINRAYSKDGNNTADFINIEVWDALADNCVKYLKKGNQCAVTGSITTGSYEKNGQKVPTWAVRASQVEFLSKPTATQPTQQKPSINDLQELDEDTSGMPF